MTDTANAPERIKAWMQPYFSEIGSWSTTRYPEVTIEYVLATHCDELVAAAKADGAREAQAKIARLMEALDLADTALTEAEAILGGEYGDQYQTLCDNMIELRDRITALQENAHG